MSHNNKKKLLVTGGAGYIGSHTCIELVEAGYELIVIDNLSNSSKKSLDLVERIVGKRIELIVGDIRIKKDLRSIFAQHKILGVLHFAGLKSVNDSINNPLKYFDNNFYGTLNLCEVMSEFNCKTLIFSSSATVYGDTDKVPINEDFKLSATNPYGRSKLMVEEMLRDIYLSDKSWSIGILRYFNPVGAHRSGVIGENPNNTPNNLMPILSQIAAGRINELKIFGNDYPTKDGTGIRDYIHVVDLAQGHIKALEKLLQKPKLIIANLGTGKGYSVLEMVKAFEKYSGCKIPYKIAPRRDGDIAISYADPSFASKLFGWQARYKIDDMCKDAWNYQSKFMNDSKK